MCLLRRRDSRAPLAPFPPSPYLYPMITITPSTCKFLKDLANNNHRDWFNAHKDEYTNAQNNMAGFVDELIKKMNTHDVIETESGKKALFRIYNDVRFKKDKAPYNPRFGFGLRRAGKQRRGGYYMQIAPGNSFLAGGFFAPNAADLLRIRHDISDNYADWKKMLGKKQIKENFGGLVTQRRLATCPKGFFKDNEAIELLRLQQFILRHNFTDKEILAPDFLQTVHTLFKSLRPYFDYMSEVLTTDRNGESLR
jgi:uncharacterized protein (TIGR02453 family)